MRQGRDRKSSRSNNKNTAIAVAVLSGLTAGLSRLPTAQAGSLYWTGTNTWSESPALLDWSSTNLNPVYSSNWSDGSTAVFWGSPGTATVSGTIASVNGITFATDAYNLSGGTLNLTGTGNIMTGPASDKINSTLAGSVGLNKYGAGNLILTGSNTYSGQTNIFAGSLQLGAGGTTGSLPVASNIVTYGNLVFNRSNAITQGVDFGTISGTGNLIAAGTGTVSLNASNTVTSQTDVFSGSLAVNFASSSLNSNIISSGSTGSLWMTTSASSGFSTFTMVGKAGTNNVQAFSGTAIQASGSTGNAVSLVVSNGSGGSALLSLGNFVIPGGISGAFGNYLDMTLPGGVQNASNGITGSGGGMDVTNGLLCTNGNTGNAYATVNGGQDWAGIQNTAGVAQTNANNITGNFVAYSGYVTATTSNLTTATSNMLVNSSVNISAGTVMTVSTLKFLGGTSGSPITLSLPTGANTLQEDGILVPSGNFAAINGVSGAVLQPATPAGAGYEQFMIVNNGGLTINIPLADAPSKPATAAFEGAGTTTLTAANTYTGATYIGASNLVLSGTGTLGSGSYSGAITDLGTLTLATSATQTISGAISGNGLIVMAGVNQIALSGTSSFTGNINVSSGTLQISGAGSLGSGNYAGTINTVAGGTFLYSSSTKQLFTGTVTGNGALNVSGGATFSVGAGGTTGSVSPTVTIVTNGTTSSIAFNRSNGATQGVDFGSVTGTGNLLATGSGTTTLNATNNYTGQTEVFSGSLLLNYAAASAPTSNIINVGGVGTLYMTTNAASGLSTFTMQGKAGTNNSQTIAATALQSNLAATFGNVVNVVVNNGSGGAAVLNLGSYYNSQIGTNGAADAGNNGNYVDFTLPGGVQNASNGIVISGFGGSQNGVAITDGLLANIGASGNAYATVNGGSDWAALQSTAGVLQVLNANLTSGSYNIIPLPAASYTTATAANLTTATGNYVIGSSFNASTTTTSVSTMKFVNGSAGSPVVLGLTSGVNSLQNGLLVPSGVAAIINVPTGGTINCVGNNGGTAYNQFLFVNNGSLTINGPLAGNADLAVEGAGTTTVTGASTYAGNTSIGVGTLSIGGSGTLGASGVYTYPISNLGSLVWASSSSQTLSGAISGTGSVVMSGSNTLTLNAGNTFSGGLTINSGIVKLGNSSGSGSTSNLLTLNTGGTFDINGTNPTIGTLAGTGGTILNGGSVGATLTVGGSADGVFNGNINGPTSGTALFGLTRAGTGTTVLGGTNTINVLQITGGTIDLTGSLNVPALSGTFLIASTNGTGGNFILDNNATLTVSATVTDYVKIGGNGNGTFIQNPGSTFNFNPAGSFTTLYIAADSNSVAGVSSAYTMYGGTLNMSGHAMAVGFDAGTGSLNVNAGASITNLTTLSIATNSAGSNGVVNLNGGSITANQVTGSGGTSIFNFNGGTLQAGAASTSFMTSLSQLNVLSTSGSTIDNGGFAITLNNGLLHGGTAAIDGGMNFQGSGTTTVAGAGTFNGGTNLNAGSVQVNNATGLGVGSINLSGGTLINNNVAMANNLVAVANTSNIIFNYAAAAGGSFSGNLSGGSSKTVIFSSNAAASTYTPGLPVGLSTFSGTIQVNLSANFYPEVNTANGGANVNWVVNGSGGFLYTSLPAGSTVQLGALSGNGLIGAVGFGTNWQVGALNTDTTFTGTFVNNTLNPTQCPTGLIKTGSGMLTLTGNNNYTGPTTISAGTLVLTGSNVTYGNTQLSGGVLTVSNQNALQYSTLAVNTGDTGTVNFTVPAVTLGGLSGGRSLSLGTAAVTIGNNTQSTVYSGNLSGGSGITKVGSGVLTLMGNNSYAGATTINAGTIRLGGMLASGQNVMAVGDSITYGLYGENAGYRGYLYNNAIGTGGAINYVGTSITNPGYLPGTQQSHDGWSGWSSLDVLGGGGATAANDLTHGNISSWVPSLVSAGQTPGIVTMMIGTNDYGQGITATQTVGYIKSIIDSVYSNDPSVKFLLGSLTPRGSNAAELNTINSLLPALVTTENAAGDHVTLVDLNTNFPANGLTSDNLHPSEVGYLWMAGQWYSAITALNSPSGVSNALPSTTALTLASGAHLDVNNTQATVASLTGTSGSTVALGGGSLTVGDPSNTIFAGSISDTGGASSNTGGSLIKVGSGMLTLSGSSTYTGATNVSAGTLTISGSVVSTAISVGSSGTLSVTSTGSIPAASNLIDNGITNFASSAATIATLNGAGALNLNSTALTITAGGAFSGIINDGAAAGSLNLSGGTLTLSGANIYSGNTLVTGGTLVAAAVNTLSPNSSVNVSSGTLDASGFNNSIAALTIGTSGTLNLGYGTILTDNSTASFAGTLNMTTGTPSVSLPELLMSYASYSGGFTTVLGVPAADTLSYTPTGLMLIANGPFNLTYLNTNGPWDTATSLSFNGSSGPTTFHTGDTVTFDDSNPSGPYTVTVSGTVTPAATIFNTSNASPGYVVTGGTIAGTGSLTKYGTGTVTLSGSNTYTGGTNVAGGTLILASSTAFPNNANAGTGLSIASLGQLMLANHATGPVIVPQISTLSNNGTIDITNNAMVIRSGNASIGTLFNQIQAGYNGGGWNGSGSGIISSSTAAADPTHLTAVGLATGISGTFEGLTVTPGDVLIKYTYYGDANLDGQVDSADYTLIDNGYLTGATGWMNGDFNYDGFINGSDYTLIDNAFNTQGAPVATQIASPTALIAGSAGTSAVPEPASLSLLNLGAAALLGRRRRKM